MKTINKISGPIAKIVMRPLLLLLAIMTASAAHAYNLSFDNKRYECDPGSTMIVPIVIENEQALQGFQFDLSFTDGYYNIPGFELISVEKSDRMQRDALIYTSNNSGVYRVLAHRSFTSGNMCVEAGSGVVLYLTIKVPDEYYGATMQLTDIQLSVSDGTSINDLYSSAYIYYPIFYDISLNHTAAEVIEGDELQLIATIQPAMDMYVTWTSSDPTVASVNDDGLVTAIAPGTAVITATTTDGTNLSASCMVTVTPKILVSGISLSQTAAEVIEGRILQLTATVQPDNATNPAVVWSTSNAEVATVNSAGLVTAVAPGTAAITAAAVDGSNLSAVCSVTVNPNVLVSAISLNQTDVRLIEGDNVQLSATVLPDNAINPVVSWTSSNPAVATVDDHGLVTAIASGTAFITATSTDGTNLSASCKVTVTQGFITASDISLSHTTAEVLVGLSMQLTAAILPDDATNPTVTWTSSAPSVATVDDDGTVTGVSLGTAVTTATSADGSNLSASCEVFVSQAITFADPTVKSRCVQNWDTNGDGELSFREAAAVTSLNTVFKSSTITSFDELQYFTGLTAIGSNAFYYCSSLTNIAIPNSVTTINSAAFTGCSALGLVTIGTGMTTMTGNEFPWKKAMRLKMLSASPPLLNKTIGVDTVEVPIGHTLDYVDAAHWSAVPVICATDNGRQYYPVPYYAQGDRILAINGQSHGVEAQQGSVVNITLSDSYHENPFFESVKYRGNDILDVLKADDMFSFGIVAEHALNAVYSDYYASASSDAYDITLSSGGTLIDEIGTDHVLDVRYLKVTGDVNGTDILAIRKMVNLYILDLSDAHIVDGGASYFENYTTSKDAIGSYFFQGNANLAHILLPNDLKTIKNDAFKGMTNLKDIRIPGSVTSIGGAAFSGCTGLTDVILKDGTTTLSLPSSGLFSNCPINYVYLGRNLSYGSSSYSPFKAITSLKVLTIGNLVTTIATYCFNSCTGLTSLIIPSGIKTIGSYAFSGCTGLTELHWNAINCSTNGTMTTDSITTITIGDEVRVLPSSFAKNSRITAIAIPSTVTTIGSSAFYGCVGLMSIDIPGTVTSIGSSAFENCTGLAAIDLPDGLNVINSSLLKGCTGLTSFAVPESVTSIGSSAFSGCTGLTVMSIPKSVTSIGASAFARCTCLALIHSHNTTPPAIQTSTFDASTEQNATLHVPSGCRTIYWLHPYWENFINIVEMDPVLASAIELSQTVAEVLAGETIQLTATVRPEDASFKTVAWTSLNPSIATVDSTGLVTAIAPGTTTITASTTDGSNLSASCTVTVTPDPATEIIAFADANVKALCVQNWDTNGDGELSKVEASAVTCLNNVFQNNQTITSFDELQYFTGLTTIDLFAFEYCGALTSVTFPNSIITIDDCAFEGCSGLTSVVIPNSVTSIGMFAFLSCTSLTSVVIPNSVTNISDNPFSYCIGLTSIIVDNGNTVYDSRSNCNAIIKTASNELISGCMNTVIPNSVTSIGKEAFNGCLGLTSVIIPNCVTTIGGGAFSGCSGLTSITFPNSVTTIGNNAFSGCSGLTSVTFPNSVTTIGNYAFKNCSGLTSINIPNTVITIGNWAFGYCNGLTDVYSYITDTNGITMGDDVFYRYPTNYTGRTLHVPTGTLAAYQADSRWYSYFGRIVEMGGNPQDSIISFADANVKAICVQNWDTNGDGELSTAEAAAVTDLNGVFRNNQIITSFNELQYFTGLTEIGNSAFEGCINLTSIEIPNSVTAIGDCAFNVCNRLTNIDIPNSVTSIGESAFRLCDMTSLIIPNSVTTIGLLAFSHCSRLADITVDGGNIVFDSRDHCNAIIETASNTLIVGCKNSVIPNSITTIGESAFFDCSELTNIVIPLSVTDIGIKAFGWCCSLTSIEIPNSVTNIGTGAFEGCSGLTSIYIPNSVVSIETGAFVCCSGLISMTVDPANTVFDSRNSCNAIIQTATNALIAGCKNTIIPNSVTNIRDYAFSGCSGLVSIEIPNSVEFIGDDAFEYCSSLASIGIPNSVTFIGGWAFSHCNNLTDVYSYITDSDGITMGVNVFYRSPANYSGRTLHVPTGTLAAYQADSRWYPYFGNIVEMEPEHTDYFTVADTSVFSGSTVVIPVAMINQESIISFQTDIFLPEGLEIVKEDGEYLIDPSSRMTRSHSILCEDVSNGSVRVLCYSPNSKPFMGESGDDLFYITVKVADDAAGDYTITLRNTLLTTSGFEEIAAPEAVGVVNVMSYPLGDANGSGTVTVTDVVVTSQFVLERDPNPFIFEAADVNGDTNITVTDVSRIAWMVLHPSVQVAMRASELWNNGDRMSGKGITLAAGETRKVSIALDNVMDYSAFQLDLRLPDGMRASNFALTERASSHALDVNTLANGKTRALCYSPALTAIIGNKGAVLTFNVTATGLVSGDITVDGIELVTTDCQTVRLNSFAIGVNTTTGINEAARGKTVARVDYYNLAGQRIDRPESGVTIVVTTYTDGTRTTVKLIK